VSSQFLHDNQIRAGIEQMGNKASPQVMTSEAVNIRFDGSSQQDLGSSTVYFL
jgi:hypothetical protein